MTDILSAQRLRFIALPIEPHHLALGEIAIPLLGRISLFETRRSTPQGHREPASRGGDQQQHGSDL